tara:strand:- start:16 stop:786 length:771 start_codon:yes stop_codon:yes gene_type:complete
MSDNKQKNQYAAKAFLGDFGKFLLGSLPGVSETVAYFTPAAAEARKDQSGFFPELGITEGMRSLMPSKRFLPAVIKGGVRVTPGLSETAALLTPAAFEARKDQSGFLPEFGFNEGSRALDPLGGYRNDFTQNQLNADAIALAEDTGRTVNDAKQILGGGLETVIGGPSITDKVDNFLSPKEQWLAKTANSPAQQSGAWSTPEGKEQLWQQHLMHQDWKEARKSGTLDDFAAKYPQSQTAKERAIRNRIPTSMDMEF